jgi:hypothetical protein
MSWLRYHASGFSTRKVNPNLGIETREFSELELGIYNPNCKDETKTCAMPKVRPYQWAATKCNKYHTSRVMQTCSEVLKCNINPRDVWSQDGKLTAIQPPQAMIGNSDHAAKLKPELQTYSNQPCQALI